MSTITAMRLRARNRPLYEEPTVEVNPLDAPDAPPDLTPTELVTDVTDFLMVEPTDLFATMRVSQIRQDPLDAT